MGHEDDDSLEEDAMFYNANFSEESESNTKSYELGEQTIWNDHKTKECKLSFYGGANRVWKEGKAEI